MPNYRVVLTFSDEDTELLNEYARSLATSVKAEQYLVGVNCIPHSTVIKSVLADNPDKIWEKLNGVNSVEVPLEGLYFSPPKGEEKLFYYGIRCFPSKEISTLLQNVKNKLADFEFKADELEAYFPHITMGMAPAAKVLTNIDNRPLSSSIKGYLTIGENNTKGIGTFERIEMGGYKK